MLINSDILSFFTQAAIRKQLRKTQGYTDQDYVCNKLIKKKGYFTFLISNFQNEMTINDRNSCIENNIMSIVIWNSDVKF